MILGGNVGKWENRKTFKNLETLNTRIELEKIVRVPRTCAGGKWGKVGEIWGEIGKSWEDENRG